MSKIKLEEFFISSIGSGEKLKWELDNDVNLLQYADKTTIIAADIILALIPKRKKEEMFKDVNTNSILDLLKKERPDLFGILADHPNGIIWVGKNIENFKKRFFG